MRNSPPSPFDRLKEELQAEYLLAKMDMQEELAELHASETCESMRHHFAEMYHECIGVYPEQRDDLRIMLDLVQQGEQARINDILAELQPDVD